MTTVLAALPGGEGMIRQDDGEVALTHDLTHDRGQPLQPWDHYQTLRLGLGDDRMLFGGLLPPGAVSVEAVEASGVRKLAAVGGGTFAVIFEDGEHGDPALGFRDEDGGWVHRPMPAEYPHKPVADAQEPCPVCGAVEYEEYFPTEEWRGGGGTKGTDSFRPSPLIVCRVCGPQEQGGGIMRMTRRDPARDADRARAARPGRTHEQEAERRRWDQRTLRATRFPVYAAEGWAASITGHGRQGDEVTHLRVGQAKRPIDRGSGERPPLEVTTSIERHQPGPLPLARREFTSRIDPDPGERLGEERSDAAATLWFRAARRRRVARAHAAPMGETEITIDGAPEPFVIVGAPDALWVAARRHGAGTITVTARGVDPASLVLAPLDDPEAQLLGPEPAPN